MKEFNLLNNESGLKKNMSDKIYSVNSDTPTHNQPQTIDKLPPNTRYLDDAAADFDTLRRWARTRRVCRCRVSRRDPAIKDPADPRYFENLFIDDSACELHATVKALREIVAPSLEALCEVPPHPGPLPRGGEGNQNEIAASADASKTAHTSTSSAQTVFGTALSCGCRPEDGVPCEAASRMMYQMRALLKRPATPDTWARYERAKSWLGRHYEENGGGQ